MGGFGKASTSATDWLNDVWRFDPGLGQWAWMGGSYLADTAGWAPERGVASTANIPGARVSAAACAAADGRVWYFGGYGRDLLWVEGDRKDLWSFDPNTREWAWMRGGAGSSQSGLYGTFGVSSASNNPGARLSATGGADSDGNLLMFGGRGRGSAGFGQLSDVWTYDGSSTEWTANQGSTDPNQLGVYGTRNLAAPQNLPGAREQANSWLDPDGNFWLFGGFGYASISTEGSLNDLWFRDATNGLWTWKHGSTTKNAAALYGNRGIPSSATTPGARSSASSWIDQAGDLWLFGGTGYTTVGTSGALNDMWRFQSSTGWWTWMAGTSSLRVAGVYGEMGTPSAANYPGSRYGASTWVAVDGSLWLLGGYGYDRTGASGRLGDLWRFNTATAEWTWVGGSDLINPVGEYGVRGVADADNFPPPRTGTASWVDGAGMLWLFGGTHDTTGWKFNDLWRYDLGSGIWTWMAGANYLNASGFAGTPGTASEFNTPGSRTGPLAWRDGRSRLCLFGGQGYDCGYLHTHLADVWRATIFHQVEYRAMANGSLQGLESQEVQQGHDGVEVVAVPVAGATFVRWSDGVESASRPNTHVLADVEATAIFLPEGTGPTAITATLLGEGASGAFDDLNMDGVVDVADLRIEAVAQQN